MTTAGGFIPPFRGWKTRVRHSIQGVAPRYHISPLQGLGLGEERHTEAFPRA